MFDGRPGVRAVHASASVQLSMCLALMCVILERAVQDVRWQAKSQLIVSEQ